MRKTCPKCYKLMKGDDARICKKCYYLKDPSSLIMVLGLFGIVVLGIIAVSLTR